MKLLVVSDLHYSLKQFDWVHLVSAKFDLVVVAGDLLDQASAVDLDAQTMVVLKYLRNWRKQTPLLVASGNHDVIFRDRFNELAASWLKKATPGGVIVDGGRYEMEDIVFSICPWWDGEKGFESVVEQLERDQPLSSKRWFWIYHSPPNHTSLSWTGRVHFGDDRLVGLIDRFSPDMVFTGHVHQAPFREGGSWVERVGETVVFNTGMQMGAPPAFIALDTEANTASWYSQMARELVRLDRVEEKVDLG